MPIRTRVEVCSKSDLKNQTRQTVEKAQEKPVYVIRDGQPVAGIVSMEMMELLLDTLEDRHITAIASDRLQAIRKGAEELLDEESFWARADELMARRPE
jgi:PHD/YefM family antitoxin component YafN of YafNO toxin-antitoxin module